MNLCIQQHFGPTSTDVAKPYSPRFRAAWLSSKRAYRLLYSSDSLCPTEVTKEGLISMPNLGQMSEE